MHNNKRQNEAETRAGSRRFQFVRKPDQRSLNDESSWQYQSGSPLLNAAPCRKRQMTAHQRHI